MFPFGFCKSFPFISLLSDTFFSNGYSITTSLASKRDLQSNSRKVYVIS
jgi:hypothetical protein